MGGKHDDKNWDGFEKMYILDAPKGSKKWNIKCLRCNKRFASNTYQFMNKHRDICTKRMAEAKRKSSTSENNQNLMNVSNSFSSDTTYTSESHTGESRISESDSENTFDISESSDSIEGNVDTLRSHYNPRLNKKRLKSIEESSFSEDTNSADMKKHIAVFRFFLTTNADFKCYNNLQTLLSRFDPNYELPPENEFKTTILKKAVESLRKRNSTKSYLKVIQLVTHEEEEMIHVCSLLLASGEKPTFINYKLIDQEVLKKIDEEQEQSRADVEEQTEPIVIALNNYCDEVVSLVEKQFKIQVHFIIHDGKYNIKVDGTVDEISFCTYKSFDFFLKQMINCKLSVSGIDSESYMELIQRYKNLIESLNTNDLRLFEAVEKFFHIKSTDRMFVHPDYQAILEQELSTHISSVYFMSNLLHPKYHGQYFNTKEVEICKEFLIKNAPDDACNGFGYYLDRDNFFTQLYRLNIEDNYEAFWKKAMMFKVNALCEYALDILRLPAICVNIDCKDIFKDCATYSNVYFRQLIFSAKIGEV